MESGHGQSKQGEDVRERKAYFCGAAVNTALINASNQLVVSRSV